YVVNTEPPPAVPQKPSNDAIHQEISRRWDAQLALDQAVAAIRRGDADRAIKLAPACSRSAFAALLASMIVSVNNTLIDYVREQLLSDPGLAHERHYAGRTLLHTAAAAGNLAIVELLLRLGAQSDLADAAGHTPLHCLANECKKPGSGDVVRALVRAGARV